MAHKKGWETTDMDPLTIAMIGGGAAKLIGGILGGNSEEEERQARHAKYLDLLKRMKNEELTAKYKRVSGLTAGARQAATQRAAAAGRGGEAESFILPAERGAIIAGNETIEPTLSAYRSAELDVDRDFQNRPIQPSFGDYLGEIGGAVSSYASGRLSQNMLSKYGAGPAKGSAVPDVGSTDFGESGGIDTYNPYDDEYNPRPARRRY